MGRRKFLQSGNGYVDIVPFDNSICEDEFGALCAMKWYEVDPETVCQYTGLTDKNGRKIFEGDVVKHFNYQTIPSKFDVGIISWDERNCKFCRNSVSDNTFYLIGNDCEYEVIGNIFDNPEFLEGEEECGRKFERLLALSRTDNKTMVCDECGTMEALDSLPHGTLTPQERTKIVAAVTGNKRAMENFNATHS